MSKSKLTQEIKERLSIEEVVSSYLKLEKSGINMKARCPFHNEKTASFFLSPDRGSFYCFGCAKGGDIFTFIEEIENVDFKEALKILADKAGVDISQYKGNEIEKKDDDVYTILEKATVFFQSKLQNKKEALDYLKSRKIEEKSISKFRIGYSEDKWQDLYDFLKKENFSDAKILAAGLVIKNDTGRIYDRFRGRIIFPIFDEKGRVVAFTARVLIVDKESPKYINSPETLVFNKSKILYGFNFAKQIIRKHDFAILVEGQLDVIMTHQVGYTNSIASSGTSFTEDQLKLIKKYTNNLLISFDGDNAGIKSSKKVWGLALQNDMDVKVIPLPKGQDPADIISSDPIKWKDLVKNSKHIIEHLAQGIINSHEDIRKRQKEVQTEVYPYLKNIRSYTDRSYFVEKISEMFSIDKDAILADIVNENITDIKFQEAVKKEEEILPKEILYGIYLQNNIKNPDMFLKLIKQYIPEDLLLSMELRKNQILFVLDSIQARYSDSKKLISDMLSKVRIDFLEEEKEKIKSKLINDKIDVQEEKNLMRKLEEITREIKTVKKEGCHDLLNMI